MREIVEELAWQFNGTRLGDWLWNEYEKMRYKEPELWKEKRKWKRIV